MKLLQNSNRLLYISLFLLCIINSIQGFTTELLADEAYYWVYSNFLDWGYFDHPPMVAIWITISKFFFATSELSVRFFSAITLSINFYLIWLLIDHPKKKEFTWLFLLILLTTSLFNVYGFITTPDAPLLFFTTIFLLGYKKYLQEQSFWSYFIVSLSMAGMLYSKYQGILIIGFVLLSNPKLLSNYKIWLAALGSLFLFFPHLYWQYVNDFPSFKYHLFERKANTEYKFRDTYMHLINMIAIIGFTFPIVYKALYKNLKNNNLFQRALNFIVIGFIVFFFISTFKGHAQAQWIVPISAPLIIITFNFLINNQKNIRIFKKLAFVTLAITTFIRFAMANDGLLPHQFEMHGNKKWVTALQQKIKGRTPLFLDSYQNTSTYWFYTGIRPCEYNTFGSRKNHFDLLEYNKKCNSTQTALITSCDTNIQPSFSIKKRNRGNLYISLFDDYQSYTGLKIQLQEPIQLIKNQLNKIKIRIQNPYDELNLSTVKTTVLLKDKNKKNKILIPAKIISYDNNTFLEFIVSTTETDIHYIQLIGTKDEKLPLFRLSPLQKCTLKDDK